MSAAEIAKALGGAVRHDRGWLARCPVPGHGQGRGDRTPSLSLADGEAGRLLITCFAGCEARDVLAELRHRGVTEGGGRPWRPRRSEPAAADDLGAATAKRLVARSIWDGSAPGAGTLVEAYLRSRGITVPVPAALRFHPHLKHPSGERWPAMIAAVWTPDGEFAGVHRTFLARDGRGKAPVEPAKMMLGAVRGGAVRLGEAGDGMLVAEGVESTLSAMQASGRPGWAALSTSGLRAIDLPAEVLAVTIVPDGDQPGRDAAQAAALRWKREGRDVRIARLPDGLDANDMLHGGE